MNENLVDLEEAIRLLREAKFYMESTHGDDGDIYYEIRDFVEQFN